MAYEDNVHQQVHGTAMGSPVHVSVVVANHGGHVTEERDRTERSTTSFEV